MRIDPRAAAPLNDDWLEAQCRTVLAAGKDLADMMAQVNERAAAAAAGELGRKRLITETWLRRAEAACRTLHEVQTAVQNAVFDCEYELRELREREVSPAELLVDGERLIRQYRFLRRRARVMDGLLAYLPPVCGEAFTCLDHLRRIQQQPELNGMLRAPDCGFALAALEQLSEETVTGR